MELTDLDRTEAIGLPIPVQPCGPAPQGKKHPLAVPSWERWRGNRQPPNGVVNNDTGRLPNQRPG